MGPQGWPTLHQATEYSQPYTGGDLFSKTSGHAGCLSPQTHKRTQAHSKINSVKLPGCHPLQGSAISKHILYCWNHRGEGGPFLLLQGLWLEGTCYSAEATEYWICTPRDH